MDINYFSDSFLSSLIVESYLSPRRRKNHNIHGDYSEPCQRLFNAIICNSYIRPHQHLKEAKNECLIAVNGLFALLTFDDDGEITNVIKFGSELFRMTEYSCCAGVEIPPHSWHTVIALSESAILFEVKTGPFDPLTSKSLAPWAPEEGSEGALDYLQKLRAASDAWTAKVL